MKPYYLKSPLNLRLIVFKLQQEETISIMSFLAPSLRKNTDVKYHLTYREKISLRDPLQISLLTFSEFKGIN